MRKSSAITLFLALITACLSVTAETVNLSANGTALLTSDSTFFAQGSGTLSPLGATTATFSGTFDSSYSTAMGNFTFDFGSGDTLTGTFSVPSIFFYSNGNAGSGTGLADVLDGTGAYTGYTGEVSLMGNAIASGDITSSFTLSGTGTILAPSSPSPAPEPASVSLVMAASAAVIAWRYRSLKTHLRSL